MANEDLKSRLQGPGSTARYASMWKGVVGQPTPLAIEISLPDPLVFIMILLFSFFFFFVPFLSRAYAWILRG
jgi:hypothetical protein